MTVSRRQALGLLGSLGLVAQYGPARAARVFVAPDALMEAARKEGELILYSATFPEPQQEVINLFQKRFPFVRVNYVRASGGQLITRVRSEAAAGKLDADIIDHSDRGQAKDIENLFVPYAPPNAADFQPGTLVSPKLWPTYTPGWCIAWNSELVKNPPNNWMDLCKPEYGGGQIGQVIAPSGGSTWTRVMFERLVLGEDYWARQAATKPKLFPSGAPLSDAIVRGELLIAPLIYNIVFPKKQAGAPIDAIYGPEGIPIVPYGSGIATTARHPNAARLYMDWILSEEGQAISIRDQGNMTALKNPPLSPDMYDPMAHKLWTPDFGPFQALQNQWVEEWNKTYGYRQ